MAKYVEIEKLLKDIYNITEPFDKVNVIKVIQNQPVLVWNNCEDCVFDGECETHPMHCDSFMTPSEYWEKVNNTRF